MHTPPPRHRRLGPGQHRRRVLELVEPRTRVTPCWRNTAEVTASDPVRWPVWLLAIDRPASVRPTFTHTIGTPSAAQRSAASCSVRPSLNPSM